MTSKPIVIVGASAAGVTTAESLSRFDNRRGVILVDQERTIAHDRPPLSKQLLDGSWPPDRAQLLTPARFDQLNAELILATRAVGLDRSQREVILQDETRLGYSELVIATGVRPRTLPFAQPRGVHVLRSLHDSLGLRAELVGARAELVVIGGGLIGLEVASTARKLGVKVTIVEPMRDVLATRIGREAAQRLLSLHCANGVSFRFGQAVTRFCVDRNNNLEGAELADGSQLSCNIALVAIGCVPNVEWLEGSGLDTGNGVKCDEFCRAADGVWAVGDVSRWFHSALGKHVRLEHRLNASEQAVAVASNILGKIQPYRPVPFFWTDQHGVRVQFAGVLPPDADEDVQQLGDDAFIHTFKVEDDVVGVVGWNAAKAMMPLRKALAERYATVPVANRQSIIRRDSAPQEEQ